MKLGFEAQILGLGLGRESQCLGLFLDLERSDVFYIGLGVENLCLTMQ